MGIKVNLANIDTSKFDAVPAGVYEVEISGFEMKETSGNGKLDAGTPMINWEFTIKEPEEFANRKLWTNTVIHESTLFSLKALLQATDEFDEADLAGAIDFDPEDLIGTEIAVKVAVREYNGNDVNDIKKFMSLGKAPAPKTASKAKGAAKKNLLP